MGTNNQSMLIDGANPSMLWYNIAEYISNLSKSMIKTYNQRQRSNKPITWGELDKVNQDLHNQLDIIISGDRNVKTISENIKMNKKQTIRLNESRFNSLVKKIVTESVKRVLKEEGIGERGFYGTATFTELLDQFKQWVLQGKPQEINMMRDELINTMDEYLSCFKQNELQPDGYFLTNQKQNHRTKTNIKQ